MHVVDKPANPSHRHEALVYPVFDRRPLPRPTRIKHTKRSYAKVLRTWTPDCCGLLDEWTTCSHGLTTVLVVQRRGKPNSTELMIPLLFRRRRRRTREGGTELGRYARLPFDSSFVFVSFGSFFTDMAFEATALQD